MNRKGLVTVAIVVIAVLLIVSTAIVGHDTEAKSKKKYKVIFRLSVDTDFVDKKTPVKLQIFNDHEKEIAQKTVDVRSQIDDQDEEEIIMGTFKVKDTKGQHPGDISTCIRSAAGGSCQELHKEAKRVYASLFYYSDILIGN